MVHRRMSNVLTYDERQQVLTLGRLGWSLRQIQRQLGEGRLSTIFVCQIQRIHQLLTEVSLPEGHQSRTTFEYWC